MIRMRKDNPALIYGSFDLIKTKKDIFAYRRQKDGRKFMIIMNLTDKEKDYPFTVHEKLISSNYEVYSNKLRAYEANVFEVEK
ncbi:MAG: cyclomaltodextrinase C-terminal domain-containing protein [Erysipelotrichaceae bacterium]|nr:cyclomaltodextrinase C-terminal domain-containing protein [Erysipelotrichaceae bacterium]